MKTARFAVTTLAALQFAAPALADDADALPTIVVTGNLRDYQAIDTATATKTPTPLIDLPQSVSILTRRQLDDQALLSFGEALRYVPGVTVGQGEGHRDQPTIRGNNTTADFFVDGIRDDVQYFRDFYNVERIEVLKGPNALAFGRGGGGGIINRVTKTPQDAHFAAVDAAVDTYGSTRFGIDLNAPLAAGLTARVNAVYEDAETFRDVYELERYAVAPTIGVALGERGEVTLGYEYVRDARVVDRGIPSLGGVPLRGFNETFFGVPGVNRSEFDAHVVTLAGRYALTDTLKLNTRILYGDYDKTYTNAFPATPVTAGAFGVEAYADATGRRNLFSQTDFVWTVATGPVSHTLLAGVELGRQKTDNARTNGFFSLSADTTRVSVPLADPFVVPPIFFRAGPGNRQVRTEAAILGLYLQDQIAFGAFEIVAGLRYDRFALDFENVLTATRFERRDGLWSPRLGLIYKPLANVAVYGSYSRSYLPQSGDQFLSLDITTAALDPERFENYEVGAKWDIAPKLAFTAALYRLDRTNTRAAGPVAGTVVLTGEARSKGLELSLAGQLSKNWRLMAGYALQDAKIRSSTAAAPAGRKVAQVPRHQVSLWSRYDLSERLGAGVGVVHQSRSFAAISNAVELPSFTRVDAAVFVALGGGIDAQINIENIFDTSYFPTAHNDNNITVGGPRAARLTLRKRF